MITKRLSRLHIDQEALVEGFYAAELIANRFRMDLRQMDLRQFMRRQQVLSLYRQAIGTLKLVEDSSQKVELRDWIRSEFRAHKDIKDDSAIQMALTTGQRSLQQLKSNLAMSR